MFKDLPKDIQKVIAKHLNNKDFVSAKRIYDLYND